MSDQPTSSNPTLATAQKTFVNGDKKIATAKDARRVFGKSMADITAAVDAARAGGRGPSGPIVASPGPSERAPGAVANEGEAGLADAADVDPAPAAVAAPAEPAPDPMRAREAKLVEQQTRFQREKREFESYKQKTESELAEAREMRRLSQSDPLAYFEKYHGIRREAFVQVMGQQAQPKTAAGAGASAQLPPEVAQELQESRQWRTQLEQERLETRRVAEADRFAREAADGADKWPLASRYSSERLKSRGWDIARAYAERGSVLTNAEILDKIEEELADVAQLIKPQSQSKPKPSSTPAAAGNQGQAGTSAAQPTLSARSDSTGAPAQFNTHPTNKHRIADGVRAVEALLSKRT